MKAVLDASPIIAFFAEMREPGLFILLRELGYDFLVPETVFRGDITKEPSRSGLAQYVASGTITVLPSADPPVLQAFMDSHPSLGQGESEVILAVAELVTRSEEAICIIDEGPARHIANRLGLRVIGTLGILRMLEAAGLITGEDMARLKGRLRAAGFRADASLLS